MNKQKLIDKYESKRQSAFLGLGEHINDKVYTEILEDLKQLDEPQLIKLKVTIPQFVAGWMNYCKLTGVDLYHAFEMSDLYLGNYAYQKDYPKLKGYFESENNQEIFARAWLDGYDVEKEKRYYVRLKGVDENYNYLNRINHLDAWCLAEIKTDKKFRTTHTRKELEDAGFGEVFNSPLFEVEEVE